MVEKVSHLFLLDWHRLTHFYLLADIVVTYHIFFREENGGRGIFIHVKTSVPQSDNLQTSSYHNQMVNYNVQYQLIYSIGVKTPFIQEAYYSFLNCLIPIIPRIDYKEG